jgi:outer membrane protein insertion porin family
LKEAYGGVGYIMVDVNPSPRMLETAPEMDLVYQIKEGNRYRIGKINVIIAGDNPHTRKEVMLNRLSFRPGEIADIRKIRDSERRLRASAVFANDPARRPQIVFHKMDEKEERTATPKPRSIRGQSPDDGPAPDAYTVQHAPTAEPRMEYWLYPEAPQMGPPPQSAPHNAQSGPGQWPARSYGEQP